MLNPRQILSVFLTLNYVRFATFEQKQDPFILPLNHIMQLISVTRSNKILSAYLTLNHVRFATFEQTQNPFILH